MTKEQLATQLNGREIGEEITPSEEKLAKQSGLLVIFGASDDLCELRGATNDEQDAPGHVTVSRDGRLVPEIDKDDAEVLKRHHVFDQATAKRSSDIHIEALWCDAKDGPAWTYKTSEPHAAFDVLEDGEVWCRGIVIQL